MIEANYQLPLALFLNFSIQTSDGQHALNFLIACSFMLGHMNPTVNEFNVRMIFGTTITTFFSHGTKHWLSLTFFQLKILDHVYYQNHQPNGGI